MIVRKNIIIFALETRIWQPTTIRKTLTNQLKSQENHEKVRMRCLWL